MNENDKGLAITNVKLPGGLSEWHGQEEVKSLAERLRQVMPGKLSPQEALLLAQYSAAMDANPFRGEVYAYEHGGKLVLVEGYKLLVRWARRQCNFYDQYRRVVNDTDTLGKDDIAFRCYLLRQDAVQDLASLTKAGVPDAFDIVTIQAVGIVTKADRTTKEGKAMRPPAGWTWEEVARKRALKSAIVRAYGTPSPREIAEETWRVGDQATVPEDWVEVAGMPAAEREATALANARNRERRPLQESAAKSMADLGFGEEPLPTKPWKPEEAEPEEAEPEEAEPTGVTTRKVKPGRPANPGKVRGWLGKKAGELKHYSPASRSQLGLMNGLLSKILGGDQARHSWLEWTWGVKSSKALSGGQVAATLAWLSPKKSETGEYISLTESIAEAKLMLRQALLDAEQQGIRWQDTDGARVWIHERMGLSDSDVLAILGCTLAEFEGTKEDFAQKTTAYISERVTSHLTGKESPQEQSVS